MASIPILNIDEEIRKRVEKMIEFKKLNIICPNCGSPNYMTDISSVSKEYKIKCTNCNKYFKDYDEVIKLQKEKLDEAPDSQKVKSDAGKPQLSLVPRRIIFDIARIREYGNNKYPEGGKDNWKQVEPERYQDAAFRHFLSYLDDPYGVDSESGLPHLWHLACNIAFLCELEDSHIKDTTKGRKVLGKKVRENDDGSITFELTKDGEDVLNKLKERYENLCFAHMQQEPNWTRWDYAFREHDGEAKYFRTNVLTDEVQFGDFDFETGDIVPRKE